MDKPNPFLIALGTIGLIGIILGLIVTAGAPVFGVLIFILGALAFVGWLTVQAVQWRSSAS